ncbi:MAG TPA: glycosyltransferase family 2 protein [Anaerolineales bacterium]|nr:glycosyltransferase family 2 protein [Anaerolineales bacterium]
MSTLPLVTVITPSYQQVEYIERTIQSVLGQEYPNLEYWVIDGGSTDGTVDILKRYDGRLNWVSEADRGQSDALNKGFRRARGAILGWLNADDTYNPEAIRQAVAAMEEYPDVGMVYSHCNFIDICDNVVFRQVAPAFSLAREVLDHNLPQPTAFYRSDVLRTVGYLNPELHFVMDWDLFLRIGVQFPIQQVDAVWANFREVNGTKTCSHPEKFWDEMVGVFESFFSISELPAEVRGLREQALARVHWAAGVIYQLDSDFTTRLLGQQSCQKALDLYPLLEQDYQFASAQIVDWAVRRLPLAERKAFVDTIFSSLSITDSVRRSMVRQISGNVFASSVLMQGDYRYNLPVFSYRQTLCLVFQAVRQDFRWIFNRGILSRLLRCS